MPNNNTQQRESPTRVPTPPPPKPNKWIMPNSEPKPQQQSPSRVSTPPPPPPSKWWCSGVFLQIFHKIPWAVNILRDFFISLHVEFRLFGKRATVFRFTYKKTNKINRSATNEGCQLIPYRGVGIGGILQCRAGLVPGRWIVVYQECFAPLFPEVNEYDRNTIRYFWNEHVEPS